MKRKQARARRKKAARQMRRKTRQKHGLAQVQAQLAPIQSKVLEGTVVAIDPSCISASSVPGYAVYREGKLESSGTIEGISSRQPLANRLMFIGKWIRENLPDPDVLVIELIQNNVRGGRPNVSLLKAVGAIIANFECEHVIEILPVVWQKFLDQTHSNDYETARHYRESMKTDEQDAIELGRAVIKITEGL